MLITHTHMYIYIGGERGVHMTKTWHLKIIKGNCSRQQHASRELLYWIDLRICCFCFRIGGSITLSAKLVLACLCFTAIGPVQVIRTLMQFVYFPLQFHVRKLAQSKSTASCLVTVPHTRWCPPSDVCWFHPNTFFNRSTINIPLDWSLWNGTTQGHFIKNPWSFIEFN